MGIRILQRIAIIWKKSFALIEIAIHVLQNKVIISVWALFVILLCDLMVFFRWMDGTFLELDGESMEAEIDEFYREMYKLFRLFQQKQKKAPTEKKRTVRHKGVMGNPTLTMCSSVLDQIKEFKVRKLEEY